jgi:cytochrome c biogenesis protein CcdA
MSRKFFIAASIAAIFLGLLVVFRYTDMGTAALWQVSQNGRLLLPLLAVSALIDSINPCAFSVLLLTIAFLFSLGKIRSYIVGTSIAYILGIFVVYILIGLGILQTLHLFNTPHFMAKAGAVLLILLGSINVVNEFFPAFPIKLRIPQAAHRTMAKLMEKASMPAAFALGGFVGLCEFPCTGGPYLMVLGLLHDRGTYVAGLGYLLLYNLIFILPLVLILLMATDQKLLEKVQAWQRDEKHRMRLWGGVAMIFLGIIIFLL